ncbi:MAG: sigma-70 family RNA polymerase sigma factor [Planctomycetes bacterium]|nr:sigma-70 family RNA polymerase sigma factor [Planctomycetota bacterium]
MPQLSFKELVNDYSTAVMKTAIRILRDSQKAQDAHQEVFLAILKRWHKYNGQMNWGAYLYRVTVRKAMEIAKRSRTEPPAEEQDCPVTRERPDTPLRTAELQHKDDRMPCRIPETTGRCLCLSKNRRIEIQKNCGNPGVFTGNRQGPSASGFEAIDTGTWRLFSLNRTGEL